MSVEVSVIIPAYNEERLIAATVEAALQALHAWGGRGEVIVVDNNSQDATARRALEVSTPERVRVVAWKEKGAGRARNRGARLAAGSTLIFADADTQMPRETVRRALQHIRSGARAGITGLDGLDGGRRAWLWWFFWGQVRRLPLPRAKAMPALMFCTREAFEANGGFDERVAIGEEWPILADVYRRDRRRLVYDRTLRARTSSRRMELQPLGYLRTGLKYVWAILDFRGRVNYSDRIR